MAIPRWLNDLQLISAVLDTVFDFEDKQTSAFFLETLQSKLDEFDDKLIEKYRNDLQGFNDAYGDRKIDFSKLDKLTIITKYHTEYR